LFNLNRYNSGLPEQTSLTSANRREKLAACCAQAKGRLQRANDDLPAPSAEIVVIEKANDEAMRRGASSGAAEVEIL
jgi:hypothetical protein